MTSELWINLPVKDINKSKEFFKKIGFTLYEQDFNSNESAGIVIGSKNIVVMLFSEPTFKGFVKNEVTDTSKSSEVLFSFSADTRDEVDEIAKLVKEAGGNVFGEPAAHESWMYGCGFADLDGHRWNVLFMDMNAFPEK